MTSVSSCLSRLDKIAQMRSAHTAQHISFDYGITTVYTSDKNRVYVPNQTGNLFHNDDSFVRLVMGPYGSGKSTLCIHEIVKRACEMPVWSSGRRKSKWIVVRNTSGELYSTTLQTWLTWFGELGDIKKRQKPLLTYEHTFNDGNGIVELDLVFIALDREDDMRKVKSIEATGVYINELSEVPQGALSHLKGRVNKRYPSIAFCQDNYFSGIICDTNPPDEDCWIYKDFEQKSLQSYKIFKQPPGLLKTSDGFWYQNPQCDNYPNLSSDYYPKLAEGQSEDFVKVFCLGQYGSVGFGKKVYPEFNSDLHAVDDIPAIQGKCINLGWDGGLTPACIVSQISDRGQYRVLKEYVGVDMGIRTFAQSIVLPGLARDFPYCKIGSSVFDPSGVSRDNIMEEMSCIGELNSLGIVTLPAKTNTLDPRLGSVRYFLNIMIDGRPGFLLSKKGCPVLYRGFTKDYIFKRVAVGGEERYRNEPDKNMSSHPHDALQYDAMEHAAERIIAAKGSVDYVDMYNPVLNIF